MLTPDLPIETERLLLRVFTPDDAVRYHSYRSLSEAMRYIYRDPITMEQAVERMKSYAKLEFENDGDVFFLAIQPKDATEHVGEILFKLESVRGKQGEIGWSLHPDSVGKGYVTEAARALMKYGFEHFGFHRIFANIVAENAASVRVAERLGMRREAHFIEDDFYHDRWSSTYIYATLATEFAQASE